MSSTPTPVLALHGSTSSAGRQIEFSISIAISSGRGVRQVDLVHDRDHLELGQLGEVSVGDGLRLDALRGVDEEQRALAGLHGLLDLVAEVDVPGVSIRLRR